MQHVEFTCQLAEAVRDAVDDWLAHPSYIFAYNAQLDTAFAVQTGMHLERFLELKETIQAHLPQMLKPADIRREVLQELEPEISRIKLGHFNLGQALNDALSKLDRAVRFGVFQRYLLPLKHRGMSDVIPPGFQLRENPAYQVRRVAFKERARNLASAKDII